MTQIGHNSVDPVLKGFVDRIENLEAEKKSYADDIREVYAEAKDKDIDVKALRTVIRLRKQEAEKRRAERAAVDDILFKLGMLVE